MWSCFDTQNIQTIGFLESGFHLETNASWHIWAHSPVVDITKPISLFVWQSLAIFHSCFNMQNWFMKHFNAPKHLILLFPPCSFKYSCNLVFVWVPALPRQSVCLHWVSDALWLTCRQFPIPKYLLNELRLNWGWTPACSSSEKTKRREEY